MVPRPELCIFVKQAGHFFSWERPHFAKWFDLVNQPSDRAVLLAFGPDVFDEAVEVPCRLRIANLFPGFGFNPVHNEPLRERVRMIAEQSYDLVLHNAGPLELALKGLTKILTYPLSVDAAIVGRPMFRTSLTSLLHASAIGYPQKDWERNQDIMRRTGLHWEVFPPRQSHDPGPPTPVQRALLRARGASPVRIKRRRPPQGYVKHKEVVRKYRQYDGFVHVARDIKDRLYIDGKYTATLIEAGLTGAILFWHDTFGLGNTLETVFELPLDEQAAAERILDIRASIDVPQHSRRTVEELRECSDPAASVRARANAILALLE